MQRELSDLKVGDRVAIVPAEATTDNDLLQVLRIMLIGQFYLQLENGWVYAVCDGRGIGHSQHTRIIPTHDEHREGLRCGNNLVPRE
jgi:hypothetical protein